MGFFDQFVDLTLHEISWVALGIGFGSAFALGWARVPARLSVPVLYVASFFYVVLLTRGLVLAPSDPQFPLLLKAIAAACYALVLITAYWMSRRQVPTVKLKTKTKPKHRLV